MALSALQSPASDASASVTAVLRAGPGPFRHPRDDLADRTINSELRVASLISPAPPLPSCSWSLISTRELEFRLNQLAVIAELIVSGHKHLAGEFWKRRRNLAYVDLAGHDVGGQAGAELTE